MVSSSSKDSTIARFKASIASKSCLVTVVVAATALICFPTLLANAALEGNRATAAVDTVTPVRKLVRERRWSRRPRRRRRTSTPTLAPVSAPSPSPTNMPEIVWSPSNEASMEFCQAGNTYGYRLPGTTDCKPAGVLVRMAPGQSYKMTVVNTSSETTNVHTHGLHISGEGNADDVTRHAEVGCSLNYHWDIPSNHMGGTFWMHAHPLHSTEAQVTGGAFAMLIIEEQANLLSNVDAGSQANIADWVQKELLLVASKVGNTVSGNGVSNQSLDMFVGDWYRLRVVGVDPTADRHNLVVPNQCDAHAVAFDGVWRTNVPGNLASSFSVSGASRIDLAIRCNTVGSWALTYGGSTAATLVVPSGSSTTPNATPFTSAQGTWQPFRPPYLRDLTSLSASDFNKFNVTLGTAGVNGVTYIDENTPPLGQFDYGSLQEWTIERGHAHPYHLHVYHVQAVSGCEGHELGEYYDVIAPTADEDCVVRFDMRDVGGRIMMHCHILRHEDSGAMGWVNVTGGPVPSELDKEPFNCPA